MSEQNAPEQTAAPAASTQAPIVARGGSYYRNARFALFALFLAFGAWCCYDGYYNYPRLNAEAIAKGQNPPHGPPHASWDVPLNRILGGALPIAAIAMLARALYRSRGEYRLEGTTLHLPGHPPISLDSIRRIDKRLWDKKGIAVIDYERPDGSTGRFTLDDFVYQREPIDKMLEIIEAHALAAFQNTQT